MGVKTFGPPKDIVLDLARLVDANAFIETGTFQGVTARWAAAHFDRVWTIEKAEPLYRAQADALRSLKGVEPLLGDSRDVLPTLLGRVGDLPAVFWLDGHWSGGITAGESDECPLLGELSLLSARRNDIILIDDARFLLSAPPHPHVPSQWPTMTEIMAAFSHMSHARYVQVIDDVIFAVPDDSPAKKRLTAYAQQCANDEWRRFIAMQNGSVFRRTLRPFVSTVRKAIAAVRKSE